MTEAELMDELAASVRGTGSRGMTATEMRAKTGRCREYVAKLIRVGLDNGSLVRGYRHIERIDGRITPVAVYIKRKGKPYVRS